MSINPFSLFFRGPADDDYVAVDIGTSAIKVMQLDLTGERPRLKNAASAPTPANSIKNNVITDPEAVGAVIRSLLDANSIASTKAITAVPGPSAFTKKIRINAASEKDLETNLVFEASNFIPHNVDAVHLDFQVLHADEGTPAEVMLVAVKNEIIDSFIAALKEAGLDPAIADVDYFALENMFELNYPEARDEMVAVVNMGSRYTSVSIMHNGESLFAGDVSVGGRLYTDALAETLNLKASDAEQLKMGGLIEGVDQDVAVETIDRTNEHVSSELHRQLGFFWNAAATERPIDAIYLCGGAILTKGLLEELSAKTGMVCNVIETFRGVDVPEGIDQEYLSEITSGMAVSLGLAMRRLGDKPRVME